MSTLLCLTTLLLASLLLLQCEAAPLARNKIKAKHSRELEERSLHPGALAARRSLAAKKQLNLDDDLGIDSDDDEDDDDDKKRYLLAPFFNHKSRDVKEHQEKRSNADTDNRFERELMGMLANPFANERKAREEAEKKEFEREDRDYVQYFLGGRSKRRALNE